MVTERHLEPRRPERLERSSCPGRTRFWKVLELSLRGERRARRSPEGDSMGQQLPCAALRQFRTGLSDRKRALDSSAAILVASLGARALEFGNVARPRASRAGLHPSRTF